MTSPDSSSGAESSMDDGSNGCHHHNLHLQTVIKPRPHTTAAVTTTTTASQRNGGFAAERFREDNGHGQDAEEGDPEVWETFSKSFSQVQSVLDRNRALIQQVNENHQSMIPDNLVKNVALIQELNGNISKVVSLYSDLSSNFSTVFHQRNEAIDEKIENGEEERLDA